MRAVCPCCGAYGPLETFLADEAARRAVAAACALPGDLPRLVWPYLGLFRRPGQARVLRWERAERLVAELAVLIAEAEHGWKGGRVVPHRPEHWARAMETVLDRDRAGKLERPLENHNYLRAIAYELAERDWYAAHAARHAEAQVRPSAPAASAMPGPASVDLPQDYVPAAVALRGWRERLGLAPRREEAT